MPYLSGVRLARHHDLATVFLVIVLDAHKGLQMHNIAYTGFGYTAPHARYILQESEALMEELKPCSQVVYGYSDCVERFTMNIRLHKQTRSCAVFARSDGLLAFALSNFWQSIMPFLLGMASNGTRMTCWHHTDYGDQLKLQYLSDHLIKTLSYLALRNSWGGGE